MSSLKNRIENYFLSTDYSLLPRVPIIIYINGKSFSKLTSMLKKPYCEKFAEAMQSTMLKLCVEVEGTVFAYQFSDEIILISRNDQSERTSPWFDNKLQKICSATSAIATNHFSNVSSDLDLLGEAIFLSHIFAVPSVSEAANVIISKQQQNFYVSVQSACFYELVKYHNKNDVSQMLKDLSIDEMIDLLVEECNIDFNSMDIAFRMGTAAYRTPKIIDGIIKNKWIINNELPILAKEQDFLINIIRGGNDIYRGK